MTSREIIICTDPEDLFRHGADRFIAVAQSAIDTHGYCAVALSGGSTPRGLYSLLASREYRERIDWTKIHFFWGDERCVAPHHQDSNYRMADEGLLSKISLPQANIHRMQGERGPTSAAAAYEADLRAFFQLAPGNLPRFDLVLLGLGDDGHTASLFPGMAALSESKKLVVDVFHRGLQSHRLTLTLPVLNRAAAVMFLVSGSAKAEIVRSVLAGDLTEPLLPAARVAPTGGHLIWLVTDDAATLLPPAVK